MSSSVKIRGIKMLLHPHEQLSNHLRREQKFFEPDILDYLRDHHQKQQTEESSRHSRHTPQA